MIEELRFIENRLLNTNGLRIGHIQEEAECKEYDGYNFDVGAFKIKYRKAKITPKKIGQFVTLWKRNSQNQTEPFDIRDSFDFYVITTQQNDRFGLFLFPKHVLVENHILTNNGKGGKRGFRVYPDWDIPLNKQAERTKMWQTEYFIDLTSDVDGNIERFGTLLNQRGK